MSNDRKGRIAEIFFAIFSLVLVGLTGFSFLTGGLNSFVDGWNKLNGIDSNILFEYNVAAMANLVLQGVVVFFSVITAMLILANTKSKEAVLKPLTIFICVSKFIGCTLFLIKINLYWNSAIVSGNLIFWMSMISVVLLDFVISALMVLLAYDKKMFVPTVIIFSTFMCVLMVAQIVNTHLFNFVEVPLLPETPIWQSAEMVNEGHANMASYMSMCIALMGICLACYTSNSVSEEETFRKVVLERIVEESETAESEEEVPETEEPETEEPETEESETEEPEVAEPETVELKTEEPTPVETEADKEDIIKIDEALAADLEEILGVSYEDEEPEEELVESMEEVEALDIIEEPEVIVESEGAINAKEVADQLIALTLRLQKGEISNDEYDSLKKELFDKL